MRSVGPDDPGRTNVSIPAFGQADGESLPASSSAPPFDNGRQELSGGFVLGDLSSPNVPLGSPPPTMTSGPESIPELFRHGPESPAVPPPTINAPSPWTPTPSLPTPSSSAPPPSKEAVTLNPFLPPTDGTAPALPPPPPSSPPLSSQAIPTPPSGVPVTTPTPPSGVPLPPAVAATPFHPIEPLPMGAPRPMGRSQPQEIPTAVPPKPPADLFVQKAPAVVPTGSKFPSRLVIGLSAAAIALVIVAAAIIVYVRFATQPVVGELPQPAVSEERPVAEKAPTVPENMIAIPGGEYTIGRNGGDFFDPYESPQHTVTLRPFYIDKTEVTNADYQKFVEATGHPAPSSWPNGRLEPGKELFPVTGVTLADAEAYATWAGKRLPTEAEWEVAAHGKTPSIFPWGNTFDPSRANVRASGLGVPVRVGTYPAGASPFGVLDMTGNVWEWTASEAGLYPGSTQKPPSWDKPLPDGVKLQIIRGGAFTEETKRCTVTYRNWVPSDFRARELGFRCAKDQFPE